MGGFVSKTAGESAARAAASLQLHFVTPHFAASVFFPHLRTPIVQRVAFFFTHTLQCDIVSEVPLCGENRKFRRQIFTICITNLRAASNSNLFSPGNRLARFKPLSCRQKKKYRGSTAGCRNSSGKLTEIVSVPLSIKICDFFL